MKDVGAVGLGKSESIFKKLFLFSVWLLLLSSIFIIFNTGRLNNV